MTFAGGGHDTAIWAACGCRVQSPCVRAWAPAWAGRWLLSVTHNSAAVSFVDLWCYISANLTITCVRAWQVADEIILVKYQRRPLSVGIKYSMRYQICDVSYGKNVHLQQKKPAKFCSLLNALVSILAGGFITKIG